MKTCPALLAALVFSLPTFVAASDFTHKPSGLAFTLPEGWECTEDDDGFQIENEDETIVIAGGVIPKESAKAILGDISKFVGSLDGFHDVKVTVGPKAKKVNGLNQTWYQGTTTIKGDDDEMELMQWDLTIVKGGKETLFLIGLGKLEDDADAYSAFFATIEKAGADAE